MRNAPTRLGVDLGTTWTAAAVRRAGTVEALELGTDAPGMPSIVAVSGADGGDSGEPGTTGETGETGRIIAGERAERQLLIDPVSGLREIKRRLGDTAPMVMAGTPYGAEALMGHLLRHVVAEATAAGDGGTPPDEVVLTHPAVWGDYKLELLREAARQAGVADVTLMPEPVAAALHYVSLGRLAAGDVVAVYDFGGGTFDAAVVQCTERGAEILGRPEGLERLGGVDLDQIVVLHVNQALGGRLRGIDATDPEARRALARLRAECTAAKEALSRDTEVAVPVALPGLHTEVRITRDEFEAAARSRIADTLGALDRAVADAAVDPSALAGVLLVGGSSRMPVVAEEVGRRTGRPTLLDADPKLVVALGAAGGSTVMTPTRNTGPADAAEGTPTASTRPPTPPLPPPPPPGRPGGPGGAPSASAQAGARAAALRAAAGNGKPPARSGAATAVGAVGAAAAATAAGYVTYEYLTDDDKGGKDDDASADEAADLDLISAVDDSMDAFDDLGGAVGTRGGGGGRGFSGGGGGRDGAERVVIREQVGSSGGGAPPAAGPHPADISEARAELLERFAAWEPPAGADAAEVATFRTEIEGLINRYQPRPGMSANDALAELRQQFDDQVEDFVQDLKLDAVIEDRDGGPATPAPAEPAEARDGEAHWEWNAERDRWEWDRGSGPAPEEAHWEWDAEQGRWEWDRGTEPKPAEPHWEWDAEQGDWRWDDGPDPLPPTRDGFEWVPTHVDENGQTVSGHWDRARAVPDYDRPGLEWVAEHVDEYGRHVPAHWEAERVDEPAPTSPPAPEPPVNVPMPENATVRTWVDGHYDEHGDYVRGHWEESSVEDPTPRPVDEDAPPPLIDNPPTAPPPAPPTPPTAPPPGDPYRPEQPSRPPVVRDHREDGDATSGGVVVRDHRDGADATSGGVVVRDHRGDRDRVSPLRTAEDRDGGANVRDHRAGAQPAPEPAGAGSGGIPGIPGIPGVPGIPGLPGPLQDVFENAVPGGHQPFQPLAAPRSPAPDPAEDGADPAPAGTAPAEASRATDPAASTPLDRAGTPEPAGSDDLLGVEAFADATATAPELELAAEIPAPAPEPVATEPEPTPVVPAPEPVAVTEPASEMTVMTDPVPADPTSDFTEPSDLDPETDGPGDDDDAPADLDTDPHTPL